MLRRWRTREWDRVVPIVLLVGLWMIAVPVIILSVDRWFTSDDTPVVEEPAILASIMIVPVLLAIVIVELLRGRLRRGPRVIASFRLPLDSALEATEAFLGARGLVFTRTDPEEPGGEVSLDFPFYEHEASIILGGDEDFTQVFVRPRPREAPEVEELLDGLEGALLDKTRS